MTEEFQKNVKLKKVNYLTKLFKIQNYEKQN